MATQMFINLPVKDLKKSMDFFKKLGFSFNMQFTDDNAACMVITEGSNYAMLLNEEMFKTFTNKPISDRETTEVLIALDAENREKVDEMVKKAVDAGGKIYNKPQDHGWMYQHAFEDLDGHQWEIAHMDMSQMQQE